MKKTLGEKRTEALREKLSSSTHDENHIENVVITTPQHMSIYRREERNKRLQSMITATELDQLEKSIERATKSDIVRELILNFLGLPTEKPENRELILRLIKKNNSTD